MFLYVSVAILKSKDIDIYVYIGLRKQPLLSMGFFRQEY